MNRRASATRAEPLDAHAQVERLESLLARARELESALGALLHEVEGFLDGTEAATQPNPRRAHQLLGTAHNALQGARGCLDRRLHLTRETTERGSRSQF
jgi:hypothetical protein